MYLQAIVVFIVSILLLLAADIAEYMFHIHVSSEFILIEEVFVTELTIGVHKGDITEFIHITLL